MFLRTTQLLTTALLLTAACDGAAPDTPTDAPRPAAGKADQVDAPCSTDDDCADDEVCEPGICLHHCSVDDPDCCSPNACVPQDPEQTCNTDDECGDGQACQPGFCYFWCEVGDPTCCEPGVCIDVEPEPEPEPEPELDECQVDADCSKGEHCQPGLCYFWCEVGDPTCCAPNTCVAD